MLRDDLAALRLLFPSKSVEILLAGAVEPKPSIDNAGELFKYLIDRARQELLLGRDGSWKDSDRRESAYVPYPLVQRILDIVHRLRPDTCLTLPIGVDQSFTRWIQIPYGIGVHDKLHINIIANFVWASILNWAMSAGFNRADIDLQNLDIPPSVTPANSGELLTGEMWQKEIRSMYQEGGYQVLLDHYLRDYNTPYKNINFVTNQSPVARVGPSVSDSLAIGSIGSDLSRYLKAQQETKATDTNTPDYWLLGADIGGTLTKCQLFGFWVDQGRTMPLSSPFLMSTLPLPGKVGSPVDYAQRLVKLVKEKLDAEVKEDPGSVLKGLNHSRLVIGVSWLGPVRENHVAGTSGVLQYFGPFKRNIPENRIDDVWKVDIAGTVLQAWIKQFEDQFQGNGTPKGIPFVALLNDGDAEAVGDVLLAGNEARRSASKSPQVTLAIVKLGTGLAGALLEGGDGNLSLLPGLFEWGKLVLDVGAPRWSTYPQGAAAGYLSKKCLPRLAKMRGAETGYFQQDDADSAEIGLLLETGSKGLEGYKKLRAECGVILAKLRPPWGVPVSEKFCVTYTMIPKVIRTFFTRFA